MRELRRPAILLAASLLVCAPVPRALADATDAETGAPSWTPVPRRGTVNVIRPELPEAADAAPVTPLTPEQRDRAIEALQAEIEELKRLQAAAPASSSPASSSPASSSNGPESATPAPATEPGRTCVYGPDGEVLHRPHGQRCAGPVAAPAKGSAPGSCVIGRLGEVLYAPPGTRCDEQRAPSARSRRR